MNNNINKALSTNNIKNVVTNNLSNTNGFNSSSQPDNNNTSNLSASPKKTNKRIKQFENHISQKIVNLTELKSLSWKGVPFGKIINVILKLKILWL